MLFLPTFFGGGLLVSWMGEEFLNADLFFLRENVKKECFPSERRGGGNPQVPRGIPLPARCLPSCTEGPPSPRT